MVHPRIQECTERQCVSSGTAQRMLPKSYVRDELSLNLIKVAITFLLIFRNETGV